MWKSTQSRQICCLAPVLWLMETTINAANYKLRRHWQQIARLSGIGLIFVIQLYNTIIPLGTPGSQKACASPQAQGRGHNAQTDSILHKSIPQVTRYVDCETWYHYMYSRCKANVYFNGQHVQELFDISLQELKEHLSLRIEALYATATSSFFGP
jgi:hypothetical protein